MNFKLTAQELREKIEELSKKANKPHAKVMNSP